MPAYNAEQWLVPTIDKLYAAIDHASLPLFEIIIVNDGSSDQTLQVAKNLSKTYPEISVLTHANKGRYLTRKRGVEVAKYDRIFFIDTRVWIDNDSLVFLTEQLKKYSDRKVWNGHINVAKKGNVIARFGDALTLLGWRRYFKNPHLTSYDIAGFDHYPKGTGLFTCPKNILVEAMEWFEQNTSDIKNSSDDTLLIRHIAERNRIWLSPEFSATYHARTSLNAFMKHSYSRGQFFVDGFLRKGTRFYYPLLLFIVLSPVLLLAAIIFPKILLIGLAAWVFGLLFVLGLGLTIKDSLSLFILAPVFIVMYGAGIWRAIIRKVIHEK
jgi:glycosyltransferase involved in cell wall biosynthesis